MQTSFIIFALYTICFANGLRPSEYVILPGHTRFEQLASPLPHTYVQKVPAEFDWRNVNGRSYVTKMLNQHLPHYCGSCWAHATMSALADRVKIARKAQGTDINLSVQFLLNCGKGIAGSCHGGSHSGVFEFIMKKGYVPFDTCLAYEACSSDFDEGHCPYGNYECKDINICRTCDKYLSKGGKCNPIVDFPHVTVAEYGNVTGGVENMKKEIYARGPIVCSINAGPADNYVGGILDAPDAPKETNHVVSIVGWGISGKDEYWILRNSWGEYWGEMGYFRLKMGGNQIGVESHCSFGVPGSFTEMNTPCFENGENCMSHTAYVDPSTHGTPYAEIF